MSEPRDRVYDADIKEQIISVSVPLLIRLLEYAREDAENDIDLHKLVERMTKENIEFDMNNYEKLVKDSAPHGAGMALIDPNGYMLFLRRDGDSDHSGTWALPGGSVERGETPESAAEREVIEEIGYVSTGEYPISFTTHEPVKFETFVHPVPHQFEPSWLMQHSDYTWRRPDNPPEPLHPGVRNLLYQMSGYTETHGAKDEEQIAEPDVCDCLDGRAYGL